MLKNNSPLAKGELMRHKIHGLLLMPYQILQCFGYQLVGVQADYEFGRFGVEPFEPVSPTKYLVGKLFPMVLIFLGGVLQVVIVVYLASQPLLPLLFVLLSSPVLALYLHYLRVDWRQMFRIV
jgi:hypothetical protein